MKTFTTLIASLAFAASASAGGFSDYDTMLSASPVDLERSELQARSASGNDGSGQDAGQAQRDETAVGSGEPSPWDSTDFTL